MEFVSLPFAAGLVVVFVLYYLFPNRRWQRALLLMASAAFISYNSLVHLAFAVGITLFSFYAGRLLARKINRRSAPFILWGSIALLIAVWIAARYAVGVFPLGISFYTFQALAYLIEIYWEEEPENSLPDFALYMLLFMKFLSGPIERADQLLPQIKKARMFNYEQTVRGLMTLAGGAFMKLMIADRIAPSLDGVFVDVHNATSMQLLQVTMLYPIQLYADFAGYTLMAIGIGQMFGFRLSPNFNRPFTSQSTTELWRRWHMSLSFWVRDYVFTPLSASLRQHGVWGIRLSLLVTFIVIGVWHGAGIAFAAYGLFQGLLVVFEQATARQHEWFQKKAPRIYAPLMTIRTYVLFALSLLFFRLENTREVFYVYSHLFDGFTTGIKELKLGLTDFYWIVFGIAVVLMFAAEWAESQHSLIDRLRRANPLVRWAAYFVFATILFAFGAFGVENFIYTQF